MSKMKRALSLLLVMLITVTAFALPTSAASTNALTTKEPDPIAGTPENSPNQPEYPTPGAIGLSKTAAPVQHGGINDYYYEITLTIDGMNAYLPSDVVLVIDQSTTMADGNKWSATIASAREFGRRLLGEGSDGRIAIVTYADAARKVNDGQFFTDLSSFNAALDTIANQQPTGETNLQDGIRVGQQVVETSEAGRQRNMVILSDGAPGMSYRPYIWDDYPNIDIPEDKLSSYSGGTVSYTSIDTDSDLLHVCYNYAAEPSKKTYSFIFDAAHDWIDYHFSFTDDGKFIFYPDGGNESVRAHGAAAMWEAREAKKAGTTIYSIGMNPNESMNRVVMKACASNPADNKGYFELAQGADVQASLTGIFTQIAGRMAVAATNGVVIDPMSDEVELVCANSFAYTRNLPYKGSKEVYVSQGSASWDSASNAIEWNVGEVREGETATMKYWVKVKDPNAHILQQGGDGDPFFTNKKTWFDYTNYEGAEHTIKHFDVPTVALPGGTIKLHYYLVDENGNPISESGEQVAFPLVADELKPSHLWADEDGNTGLLSANYNVSVAELDGYQYYGYTFDGKLAGVVGKNTNTTVTATVGKGTSTEIWLAYRKAPEVFYVAHVRKASYQTSNVGYVNYTDTYDVVEHFNIVGKTNSSYLYGGTFKQGESTALPEGAAPVNASVETDKLHVYDQVEDFNGGTPFDFKPKAGETYYIWEVSQRYLWNNFARIGGPVAGEAGQYVMKQFSPIIIVDRPDYQQIGITVNGEDKWTAFDGRLFTSDSLRATQQKGSVYSRIYAERAQVKTLTNTADYPAMPSTADSGYLSYVTIDPQSNFFAGAGNTITCQPYWVTKDNVKVTGIKEATYTYQGAGAGTSYMNPLGTYKVKGSQTTAWSPNGEAPETLRKMVFRRSVMIAEEPDPSEEPAPTEEPVPSEEPAPTEEPAPSEEPVPTPEPIVDTRITVTVNDNDGTYQVADEPGDWTGKINYQNVSGKVFAGWFADEAFTVPVNFSNIQENTTIYAKYVSSAFLKLNYTEQRLFRSQLTLFSAIDTKNYAETGFVINGKAVPTKNYTTRYNLLFTPRGLFGNEVGNDANLMVSTYQTSGMKRGDKLTITPYWVTLDGTTVYGAERTLTNGWLGLAG